MFFVSLSVRLFCVIFSFLMLMAAAFAQSVSLETCAGEAACDRLVDEAIASANARKETGRYTQAAKDLYPAILSPKISNYARMQAHFALSKILSEAGLYEYASVQLNSANWATRAPSSQFLLEEARLMAQTRHEKAARAAYQRAARQALETANLIILDEIIKDYQELGYIQELTDLSPQRSDVETRYVSQCADIGCQEASVMQARLIKMGALEYPANARRQAGDCQVYVNITEAGQVVDIQPVCTDPVFAEPAREALETARFAPRYVNGAPEPQYNLIIPFTFSPR